MMFFKGRGAGILQLISTIPSCERPFKWYQMIPLPAKQISLDSPFSVVRWRWSANISVVRWAADQHSGLPTFIKMSTT
jgi:hypothetical protein